MKTYDLRRTRARTSTVVPETQSRKTSVSESESFDKTIDTDRFKSQIIGEQNERGPDRPRRRSLSDVTQRLSGTPFVGRRDLPPHFGDELVLPDEAAGAPDELESDHTDRQRTNLDQPRAAAQRDVPVRSAGRNEAPLSAEQRATIRAAESNLDDDQRNRIEKRKQRKGPDQQGMRVTSASESDDPGSHLRKGKGVHPGNWGALSEESEIDVELQHALMSAYKKQKRARKASKHTSDQQQGGENPSALNDPRVQTILNQQRSEIDQLRAELRDIRSQSRSRSVFHAKAAAAQGTNNEWAKLPKTLRPTAQLNTDSYLGRALFGPKRVSRRRMQDSDPDGTPSDSSSESESGSSLPGKRGSKRRGKKHSRMLIKPVAPESYDGSPDTKLFHKFVQEATNYVKDGQVRKKRRVSMIMRYLTGTAYEFYVRKVAYNPEEWTLPEFFQDLFDYCFPVNFLGLQRKNFNRCRQGTRTVREFVYELNELSLMVGDIDDRARVNRLWFGCRTDIQKELWLNKLNPEISDFETVAAAAETIELASGVADQSRDQHSSKATDKNQSERKKGGFNKKPYHRDRPSENSSGKTVQRENSGPSGSTKPADSSKEKKPTENCPERNLVSSAGGSGRPPGVRNNAMAIEQGELEQVEELVDSVEDIEELTLGSIAMPSAQLDDEGLGSELSLEDGQREPLPRFTTINRIEDPLGARVEDILEANAPYPGDENAPNREGQRGGRFVCYQVLNRRWLVMDSWWLSDDDITLGLDQLLHPRFDVAGWYARYRAPHRRGPNFFDDGDDFPGDDFPDDNPDWQGGELNVLSSHEYLEVVDVDCMAQNLGFCDPLTLQRNAAKTKDFNERFRNQS